MGTMDHLYMALLTFHNSVHGVSDYAKLFNDIAGEFPDGKPSDELLTSMQNVVGVGRPSFDIGTASTLELQNSIGDYMARGISRMSPTFKKACNELRRRGYSVPANAYYLDGHTGDPKYLVMEYNE